MPQCKRWLRAFWRSTAAVVPFDRLGDRDAGNDLRDTVDAVRLYAVDELEVTSTLRAPSQNQKGFYPANLSDSLNKKATVIAFGGAVDPSLRAELQR
jgi:hypothetical protein